MIERRSHASRFRFAYASLLIATIGGLCAVGCGPGTGPCGQELFSSSDYYDTHSTWTGCCPPVEHVYCVVGELAYAVPAGFADAVECAGPDEVCVYPWNYGEGGQDARGRCG